MELEIIITIAMFIAGIYMLGVGYKFIPDPGKPGSVKNEEHINKYRNIFKVGGILSVIGVILRAIYILLGNG